MTNKNNVDVAVESFKAVSEVVRNLDDEYHKDPQSMLRGAIHAIYSVAMVRSPSPMIALTFLLSELQHFAHASCEVIPDDVEWGRALASLDITGGEDDDETMH